MQYLDPDQYFSTSTSLRIFHHPDLTKQAAELLKASSHLDLKDHYGIFSSGTSSGGLKGYIHSLDALSTNARAVNEFFELKNEDTWALSLPDYHIGGLQVLLRAKLAGAKVVDARGWDPDKWYKTISQANVRVTSIVPTQLYDLIKNEFHSPTELRYLIVGGDFLSEELHSRAKDLGWPIIRTYGMSEAGSQIASSTLDNTSLQILPIHRLKTDGTENLLIKSPALFSYSFTHSTGWQITPISLDSEGFYKTQDKVKLEGANLVPLGRTGDEFKSKGHLIRLGDLRETLQKFLIELSLFSKAEIYFEEDERKGKRIVLLHEDLSPDILLALKEKMAPVIIDEIKVVDKIDRTALGKSIRR